MTAVFRYTTDNLKIVFLLSIWGRVSTVLQRLSAMRTNFRLAVYNCVVLLEVEQWANNSFMAGLCTLFACTMLRMLFLLGFMFGFGFGAIRRRCQTGVCRILIQTVLKCSSSGYLSRKTSDLMAAKRA